ncbi:MAG: hypothetical protein KJ710_07545 [Candidatus Omnitrophica bacterium]|nr:hypothetical protein [Candidatus Omnitrophota bacterium]MBU1924089.1 hypothetical protein [Candidatus Omnitrophota bacterium]
MPTSKSAFLLFLICFLSLISNPLVFAEDITITTYYPSPYGVYKNLRLYPNDDNTPAAACANEGEMYFDNSDSKLYVCSGSPGSYTWQAEGSSSLSFTYYCFSNSGLGDPVCSNAGGAQGFCPAGYTQKQALGQWGGCSGYAIGSGSCFLPPGGSCGAGFLDSLIVGSAYVCSQ